MRRTDDYISQRKIEFWNSLVCRHNPAFDYTLSTDPLPLIVAILTANSSTIRPTDYYIELRTEYIILVKKRRLI